MGASILVDFNDEAVSLYKHVSPLIGVVNEVYDIMEICQLSIQDNVLRALYKTNEVFLKEPLLRISDWLPTDKLEELIELSRKIVDDKIEAIGRDDRYYNIQWVSKTIGVVS